MKLEHFDDILQDNSIQSSWAGLDSFLIDEEFLYLETEEADKIYMQLKQRQFRRRNMEETEKRLNMRIRDLEAMANSDSAKAEETSKEGRMLASQETI